jgi:hypothetical protein
MLHWVSNASCNKQQHSLRDNWLSILLSSAGFWDRAVSGSPSPCQWSWVPLIRLSVLYHWNFAFYYRPIVRAKHLEHHYLFHHLPILKSQICYPYTISFTFCLSINVDRWWTIVIQLWEHFVSWVTHHCRITFHMQLWRVLKTVNKTKTTH